MSKKAGEAEHQKASLVRDDGGTWLAPAANIVEGAMEDGEGGRGGNARGSLEESKE
ncbi:MAG TPA: hypothetical protein VF574_06685 [Allosphingosinicella sp.]|jgi:hypothetical protein